MLQVNFSMICIIHKISIPLRITRVLERILGSIFKKNNFFSLHIMVERPSPKDEKFIDDLRNVFR